MKLSRLGEFGLIRLISKKPTRSKSVVIGIGDDTAAIRTEGKNLLLLTCDSCIEGVHFTRKTKPFSIGWKVMARNISDIAAMGGLPRFALIAASLPKSYPVRSALEINRGAVAAARKFGVNIVGGDTSHDRHIHLTVTLIGEVRPAEMVLRKGAKPGDFICVTGTLGGSIHGKHLHFNPRVVEGRFLASRFKPSAMMDLSDGLASDLCRLREQSNVGFEVWTENLPISPELKNKTKNRKSQMAHAITDGEDYELLFTINPKVFKSLSTAWKRKFNLKLTRIGVVKEKNFGIQFLKDAFTNERMSIKLTNDHFA